MKKETSNEDKAEILSILSTAGIWLISLFIVCISWVWFIKIDFDPIWDTDGTLVLTGIVFISFIHVAINTIATILMFIFEAWGEVVLKPLEEYYLNKFNKSELNN